MVEITEIRHGHQSSKLGFQKELGPIDWFVRKLRVTRIAQNIQEVCMYSSYGYIFRKLSLHQSSDLKIDRFFLKKIYEILVHYICGPEKKLQVISRSRSYGFSLLSEGMASGTPRDRHVFFKLKKIRVIFCFKTEEIVVFTLAWV